MTTETATLIQAVTSILQTTCAFLQTVLIAATLWYAIRESKKWRSQVVGTKLIELSYQLSDGVYSLNEDLVKLEVEHKRPYGKTPVPRHITIQRAPLISKGAHSKLVQMTFLHQKVLPQYRDRLNEAADKFPPLIEHLDLVGKKIWARESLNPDDINFIGIDGLDSVFRLRVNEALDSYLAVCNEMRQ